MILVFLYKIQERFDSKFSEQGENQKSTRESSLQKFEWIVTITESGSWCLTKAMEEDCV